MGNDAMDFCFCPDVNTSCWLVENENSWGRNQPFRQQDLLLVAAGDGIRQLLDSGCHDSRPLSEVLGDLHFPRPVDQAEAGGELTQNRKRLVRTNWKLKHQS